MDNFAYNVWKFCSQFQGQINEFMDNIGDNFVDNFWTIEQLMGLKDFLVLFINFYKRVGIELLRILYIPQEEITNLKWSVHFSSEVLALYAPTLSSNLPVRSLQTSRTFSTAHNSTRSFKIRTCLRKLHKRSQC